MCCDKIIIMCRGLGIFVNADVGGVLLFTSYCSYHLPLCAPVSHIMKSFKCLQYQVAGSVRSWKCLHSYCDRHEYVSDNCVKD